MTTDLDAIYETAGTDGADAEVPYREQRERIDGRYVIVLRPGDDDRGWHDEPVPAWMEFAFVVVGIASMAWIVWYLWVMWTTQF